MLATRCRIQQCSLQRMKGFNVLNPMGRMLLVYLQNEQLRENRHPADITKENVANFKTQR